MNIGVACISSICGKENYNIELIVNQLLEVDCLILSKSALMGLGAEEYRLMGDFKQRQEEALAHLQSKIPTDKVIITAIFDLSTQTYKTVKITPEKIEFTDILEFKLQDETICILCVHDAFSLEKQITHPLKIDCICILDEFPLETYIVSDIIPSLNKRDLKSEKKIEEYLKSIYQKYQAPVFSVPTVGYLNGVLFDGSFGFYNGRNLEFFSALFQEKLFFLKKSTMQWYFESNSKRSFNTLEHIFSTLIFGIQIYFNNTVFNKAVVAISGGIDSALVTAMCVKALGKENVYGVLMPGPYSSDHSVTDALELCKNLGIGYKIIEISNLYNGYLEVMDTDASQPLTRENIQARIRGTVLMAFANEKNALAINTCNKSEDLIGYATLYGDAIGAFAPIGDLFKLEVYELAEYFNLREYKEIIPKNIFEKEPSAELSKDQKDSDSLPTYDILDTILFNYFEQYKSVEELLAHIKLSREEIKNRISQVFLSEYKRKQSPEILYITEKNKKEWSQVYKWS